MAIFKSSGVLVWAIFTAAVTIAVGVAIGVAIYYATKTSDDDTKNPTIRERLDALIWKNGVIPYVIHPGRYDYVRLFKLRRAMDLWERFTCIKFVDINNAKTKPLYYVNVTDLARDGDRCAAQVGQEHIDSQPQYMNLSPRCFKEHTLLHEMMHTIGVRHEQKRPDRDQYVVINFDKVMPDRIPNFSKLDSMITMGLPYGYRSIVHYTKTHFAKDNTSITITTKDPSVQDLIGQLLYFDFYDIQLINMMYDCSKNCSAFNCKAGELKSKDCKCWCRNNDMIAQECESKKAIDETVLPLTNGTRIYTNNTSNSIPDRYYSLEFVDWEMARQRCINMGGDLYIANSDERLNTLRDDFDAGIRKEYTDLIPPALDDTLDGTRYREFEFMWLGGHDKAVEGVFKWLNGQNITQSWLDGEPDNGKGSNDDCIYVNATSSLIGDEGCGLPKRYICGFTAGSCYDRLATCHYYATINKCDEYGSRCPKSCQKCTV